MSRFLAFLAFSTLLWAGGSAVFGQNVISSDDIKGTYVLVSGEKDGKAIPDSHFAGNHVKITQDRIIGTDKDTKETYVATYHLKRGGSPMQIDMVSVVPAKGETSKGLIEKKGDTVRIIYAVKGGDRPMDFTTKENQHMFVMKLKR